MTCGRRFRLRRRLAWAAVLAALLLSVWYPPQSSGSSASVTQTIRKVFGPRSGLAIRVAWCESRLRPRAVSLTRDVGVFQVNYAAHRWPGESFAAFKRRMTNVDRNVRYAYRLSRGGTDWGPWRWSAHCWS